MPKIVIRVYAHLREEFGTKQVVFIAEDGATIKEALRRFAETYRVSNTIFDTATGGIHRRILLSLNGIAVSQLPDGLNTKIRDGDAIALLPLVAGG